MQLLATPQQVIDLAFAANEKITPVSIKETKIDAAQESISVRFSASCTMPCLTGNTPNCWTIMSGLRWLIMSGIQLFRTWL